MADARLADGFSDGRGDDLCFLQQIAGLNEGRNHDIGGINACKDFGQACGIGSAGGYDLNARGFQMRSLSRIARQGAYRCSAP